MNWKLVSLGLAAALFTAGAVAAQPYGRDSVYANSGASAAKAPVTDNAYNRFGRDSAYANDRHATNAERAQMGEVAFKFGRT
jgi:hypothetical protein